jgi:hypothetical protein
MVAADQLPSLNDFYAGAMALFAIILFAKFVTHRRHGETVAGNFWPRLHVACVVAAFLGLMACLIVLGWTKKAHVWGLQEEVARWIVILLAAVSAAILAFDVGKTARSQKEKRSR